MILFGSTFAVNPHEVISLEVLPAVQHGPQSPVWQATVLLTYARGDVRIQQVNYLGSTEREANQAASTAFTAAVTAWNTGEAGRVHRCGGC